MHSLTSLLDLIPEAPFSAKCLLLQPRENYLAQVMYKEQRASYIDPLVNIMFNMYLVVNKSM